VDQVARAVADESDHGGKGKGSVAASAQGVVHGPGEIVARIGQGAIQIEN
jgi:hypothetical protein